MAAIDTAGQNEPIQVGEFNHPVPARRNRDWRHGDVRVDRAARLPRAAAA